VTETLSRDQFFLFARSNHAHAQDLEGRFYYLVKVLHDWPKDTVPVLSERTQRIPILDLPLPEPPLIGSEMHPGHSSTL
jgi:hypothetical protein